MAKLFKTISLEDRYKDSRFNNAPVKPKFVMQGTVVLQAIKSTKEFESILLKSLPSAQEKNSNHKNSGIAISAREKQHYIKVN